jgi:hypothetical protein
MRVIITVCLSLLVFDACRLGHYTVPREMGEVSTWLSSRLGLEGFSA